MVSSGFGLDQTSETFITRLDAESVFDLNVGSRNSVWLPGNDFVVEPKGASGCVVVFHEIWGLADHIRDACKQLGKLGFAAVAPNMYSGYQTLLTPGNIEKAMRVVWDLSLEDRRDKTKIRATLAEQKPSKDVAETVTTLYDQDFRRHVLATATEFVEAANTKFGGVSTVGYSFGGGISLRVAAKTRKLKSAVAYCGEPPKGSEISRISSPILAIYADQDDFTNRRVPEFVEAATKAGKDLTLRILPGAGHEFFDPTKKATYNRKAAEEAWMTATWFLEQTLGREAEIKARGASTPKEKYL